jgi:hypothetical protein
MVVETKQKTKQKIGRNRGIPKTQLGFSLDQNEEWESESDQTIGTYFSLLVNLSYFWCFIYWIYNSGSIKTNI